MHHKRQQQQHCNHHHHCQQQQSTMILMMTTRTPHHHDHDDNNPTSLQAKLEQLICLLLGPNPCMATTTTTTTSPVTVGDPCFVFPPVTCRCQLLSSIVVVLSSSLWLIVVVALAVVVGSGDCMVVVVFLLLLSPGWVYRRLISSHLISWSWLIVVVAARLLFWYLVSFSTSLVGSLPILKVPSLPCPVLLLPCAPTSHPWKDSKRLSCFVNSSLPRLYLVSSLPRHYLVIAWPIVVTLLVLLKPHLQYQPTYRVPRRFSYERYG
jgi:hypothetical protein